MPRQLRCPARARVRHGTASERSAPRPGPPRGRPRHYVLLRTPAEVEATACVRSGRFRGGRARTAGRRRDPARRGAAYAGVVQAPRLVATDVDGTLLDPDDRVTPRATAVIDRLVAAGVEFVLVTGRPPRWIPPVLAELRPRPARGLRERGRALRRRRRRGALVADAPPRHPRRARRGHRRGPARLRGWPSSGSARRRTTRRSTQFIAEPAYVHAWPNPDHASVERRRAADPAGDQDAGPGARACPATPWWRRSHRRSGTSRTSRSPTRAASWRCRRRG